MRKKKRNLFFLLIIFSLLITSCAVRPVYSNKHIINNNLNAIEIEIISSIEGAEFARYLYDIMPQLTSPKYLLKVQFVSGSTPSAIQKNSDVLREAIVQSISYQLISLKDNIIVTSGKFKLMNSYSTLFSPYASYIESERATEDLVTQNAEEIRKRLFLYFEGSKYK